MQNNESQIVISVKDVAKYFSPSKGQRSIKNAFTSMLSRKKDVFTKDGYWALKDVNFEVKKGEFFGIVGRNGSGKSTLLKMIAGVYAPTKGEIKVNGKLVPFIELGVGFNPELTGKDNVYLNGALLGFSRKEMSEMYDEIVDFAELNDHMDVKLKNFSSGMQVRLAFSIAIRAKSDILLIDEVLAVGDAAFQSKCYDYFYKLKKDLATVILVSHDRTSLERFCDRGILIDEGVITESGSINKVLKKYTEVVVRELENTNQKQSDEVEIKKVDSYARISNVHTTSEDGHTSKKFQFGEKIFVNFDVVVSKEIANPILGISIWQKNLNRPIFATNTMIEKNTPTGTYKKGDVIKFGIELPNNLNDGEYSVEPAVANETALIFYDQRVDATKFFIYGSNNPYSAVSYNSHIKLNKAKNNDR